jgi:hypothetical protein
MTRGKRVAKAKGETKLKLKKETLKDLEVKRKAGGVRGGLRSPTQSCVCLTILATCKCLATGGC